MDMLQSGVAYFAIPLIPPVKFFFVRFWPPESRESPHCGALFELGIRVTGAVGGGGGGGGGRVEPNRAERRRDGGGAMLRSLSQTFPRVLGLDAFLSFPFFGLNKPWKLDAFGTDHVIFWSRFKKKITDSILWPYSQVFAEAVPSRMGFGSHFAVRTKHPFWGMLYLFSVWIQNGGCRYFDYFSR